MNLRAFLKDRAIYIVVTSPPVCSASQSSSSICVSRGASLRFVNVGYILLLAWVGLLIFLITDYRRQRGFYRRLIEAVDSQDPQLAAVLDEPRTWEQRPT